MASTAPAGSLDAGFFRRVLGQYPTGVSVVTALPHHATAVGMAVGSFTSVSLDPPLVAFLPSRTSSSWARIQGASTFCVNVLAADQEHICRAFAARGSDKFAGLEWRLSPSGAPILDGVVAWIECTLHAVHEAGDHHIVVGQVRELDVERSTLPLLFFQGGYGGFAPQSLMARDERFGRQLLVLDRARGLMEAAARELDVQVLACHCDRHELTLLASAGEPKAGRPTSAIGQRVPVVPPIGIWWMANADPGAVQAWLEPLDPATREAYHRALAEIRCHGFCLGLGRVQHEVGEVITARPATGTDPTADERERLHALAADPAEFVPAPERLVALTPGQADVVSVWAVAGDPERDGLGVGILLHGGESADAFRACVERVRQLGRAVAALTG